MTMTAGELAGQLTMPRLGTPQAAFAGHGLISVFQIPVRLGPAMAEDLGT